MFNLWLLESLRNGDNFGVCNGTKFSMVVHGILLALPWSKTFRQKKLAVQITADSCSRDVMVLPPVLFLQRCPLLTAVGSGGCP